MARAGNRPTAVPPVPVPVGWTSTRGFRELARRFSEERRRIPAASWRAWVAALGIGWALCALLAWGLSFAGRELAARGLAGMDREWLLAIAADERFSFQTAIWFEGWGSSAMLIPVVTVGFLLAVWLRRPLVALTLVLSYVLHDPLVWIGWTVWDRARPDLIAGGLASPPLHSFPSGHLVQTIAVYGFLAWLWVRRSPSVTEKFLAGVLVVVISVVVGYARLRLGAHWPSDLPAGAILGTAWLLVTIRAVRAAEQAAPDV